MPECRDKEGEGDVVRPIEEFKVVAAHPVVREDTHRDEDGHGRDKDEVDREVVRKRDLHLDRKDVMRKRALCTPPPATTNNQQPTRGRDQAREERHSCAHVNSRNRVEEIPSSSSSSGLSSNHAASLKHHVR